LAHAAPLLLPLVVPLLLPLLVPLLLPLVVPLLLPLVVPLLLPLLVAPLLLPPPLLPPPPSGAVAGGVDELLQAPTAIPASVSSVAPPIKAILWIFIFYSAPFVFVRGRRTPAQTHPPPLAALFSHKEGWESIRS
jgi:hypothetical protein